MGIGEGLVKGDQEPHPHINLPSILYSPHLHPLDPVANMLTTTDVAVDTEGKWHATAVAVDTEGKWRATAVAVDTEGKWRATAVAVDTEGKWRATAVAVDTEGKWRAAAVAVDMEGKWRAAAVAVDMEGSYSCGVDMAVGAYCTEHECHHKHCYCMNRESVVICNHGGSRV